MFTGTTKVKNLDQNVGALAVKLSDEHIREISGMVPVDQVAGDRFFNNLEKLGWKVANTPPKNSGVSA